MANAYLILALVLFFIGLLGIVIRRNLFTMFMSIELMLNATGLMFATFARTSLNYDGHISVLLIIALAAAEAAFGLGLIVLMYKQKQDLNIEIFDELKDENVG